VILFKNSYKFILFLALIFFTGMISTTNASAVSVDLVDDSEYSIKFFSDNHDNNKIYKGLLRISPKDGWKIFAKNKLDKDSLPKITLKKSENIKAIDVALPDSEFNEEKNAYVYHQEIFIPITIQVEELKEATAFEFETFMVLCKDICVNKTMNFKVDLPRIDHEEASYSLIQSFDSQSASSLLSLSLFTILALSLLGGFILNFMPCVLPVISLKILSVIKSREDKRHSRQLFVATSAGIIFCFLVIGVIIFSFKAIGQHVGLGFNFQHPTFVITVVLLIIFVTSFLNDAIYFDIPSSWKSFLIKHSEESKLFGSFASGMFVTILATPCTAPFLGVAVSMALTLSAAEMFISFLCMGIGMALPFIILSFFPTLVNLMPSPGPWIKKFKTFLEILLYLTALWLIWIVSVQLGFYPALALFLSCLLLKFFLTNKSKISAYLKMILISLVVVVAYIVPIKTSILEAKQEERINDVWRVFEIKKIDQYVDSGNVVIVDITAAWCLSCKYNKIAVLDNPFIIKFLKENAVIGLRGDYTNASKEIEQFLESYSQYGIPFTVVFSKKYPQGIILPTILKTADVLSSIKRARS